MNHSKYIPQGPFGHWHEIPSESGLTPGFSGVLPPPIPPEDTADRSHAARSKSPCSRTDTSDSPPNSSSALDNGGSVLGTEDPKKDPWLYHEWPKYPTEPTGDLNVPFYPGPKNAKILAHAQILRGTPLPRPPVNAVSQLWCVSQESFLCQSIHFTRPTATIR